MRNVTNAAALGFAAALFAVPAQAGKSAQPDCQQIVELYRACHRLGQQSGSAAICEGSAGDYVVRAASRGGAPSQGARALAELVCSTGCEDAALGQPQATVQEISEAFCDQPATKPTGGRP